MATQRIDVAMFDGTGDFGIWKKRMLANLSVQGLKDVLTEQAQASVPIKAGEADPLKGPKGIEDPTRPERDEKAMNLIFMCVGDQVLRKLDKCTTAAQVWATLDRLYMSKTLPNRVHAQHRVYSYKMQDSRSIDQNVDDFLKLIADLGNLSIEVPEEVQAILLLNALPVRYDSLKETLKYGRESIKLEEVVSAARSKEMEYKDASSSRIVGEGNYVRGRTENRSSSGSSSSNSGAGKGKNRNRSKSKDGKRVCWICGKEGHFKKQCYKWLERNKEQGYSQDKSESAMAQNDAKDLVGLLVAEVNLTTKDEDQEEWIMDTGCSFHMTPRKEFFMDMKELSSGKVRMGNNTMSEVKGIGSVRFSNPDGTTFVLHEVRYMPSISRNLMSIGALEGKGCEFRGRNGILKVTKGCTVFMKGLRRASLYIFQGNAQVSGSCVAEADMVHKIEQNEDQTQLWHSRMGHIGQKGLEVLEKKGCLENCKVSELKFCEDCVIGKAHRVSFGPAQHVTKDKLDYVHSDLWGSPNVPLSLIKSQYFISFTDDFSRKVWIYFLRYKDEAFKSFVSWKKMVEIQTERKVKKLRTDNGLEFCNNQFDGFCKEEGIVRHRTCTYTPQQNGVAERLNRSIMNKVRSMLSESGLGQRFWAEAAATAVYLINRSPSSALDFKVPEEVCTSAMPSLKGLKRFGFLAYVHSDDGKLNPMGKKGIFTGYPVGVKGFKVWLLEDQKCVISRNVVFREGKVYKEIKHHETEASHQARSTWVSFTVPVPLNQSGNTLQGGEAPVESQEDE